MKYIIHGEKETIVRFFFFNIIFRATLQRSYYYITSTDVLQLLSPRAYVYTLVTGSCVARVAFVMNRPRRVYAINFIGCIM